MAFEAAREAPVPVNDASSLGMESLRVCQLPSRCGTLVAAISRSSSATPAAEKLVSTCQEATQCEMRALQCFRAYIPSTSGHRELPSRPLIPFAPGLKRGFAVLIGLEIPPPPSTGCHMCMKQVSPDKHQSK